MKGRRSSKGLLVPVAMARHDECFRSYRTPGVKEVHFVTAVPENIRVPLVPYHQSTCR